MSQNESPIKLYVDPECRVPLGLLLSRTDVGKVTRSSFYVRNEGKGIAEIHFTASLTPEKHLEARPDLDAAQRQHLLDVYAQCNIAVVNNAMIQDLAPKEIREVEVEWTIGKDALATRYYATINRRIMVEDEF